MKFLNHHMTSREVSTMQPDFDSWLERNDLNPKTKLIYHNNDFRYYKYSFKDVSTLHYDPDFSYYCNEEFIFFAKVLKPFADNYPSIERFDFRDSIVDHQRIEMMLIQIQQQYDNCSLTVENKEAYRWNAESSGVYR